VIVPIPDPHRDQLRAMVLVPSVQFARGARSRGRRLGGLKPVALCSWAHVNARANVEGSDSRADGQLSDDESMVARGKIIRRALVAVGALLAAGTGVVIATQPLWAFDVLAWAMPDLLWRVETNEPLVALSFDDGPAADHTPDVLEILSRHKAHATFFLIGNRAVGHPELVRRLRSEGHEIGNHYFSIQSTLRATDDEFVANLMHTEEVLGLAGPLKLFRPPGGRIRSSQSRLAQERGYRVVLGSAYPYDGSRPPSAYIQLLVTKNLAPGVIIILHDGIADPSRMIAVLDSILAAGERKGLRFVTVGSLLQATGRRTPHLTD
jgi:peptidoglycan/xylan/chitin deacetylase (PgdA/CDA1 family)